MNKSILCVKHDKKKSAEFCSFSHVKTFSWNTMMKLWKIINFLFFLLKMFFSVSHMKKNKSGFFFLPILGILLNSEKKEKVLSMKPKRNSGFILDRVLKESLDIHFLREKLAWHIPGGKKEIRKNDFNTWFYTWNQRKSPLIFFFPSVLTEEN